MAEEDVKDLIVNSATIYFSKFGFQKTTMDEIARHIHKAKGVIYYYFKSKEELFNAALKKALEDVKTELNKITTRNADALTILQEYFLTRLKMLSTVVIYHETLKADFFEEYKFVKDVRDDFAAFEYEQLTTIMKRGKKEGFLDIKNIETNVRVAMMILSSIEIPLYLQNKFAEFEDTIEELATMVLNSFRNLKKG